MNDQKVLDECARLIRDITQSGPVEITRATRASDVRGWDSLTHTIILMQIEEHFDLRLPLDRVPRLRTVGELADLISELKPA